MVPGAGEGRDVDNVEGAASVRLVPGAPGEPVGGEGILPSMPAICDGSGCERLLAGLSASGKHQKW